MRLFGSVLLGALCLAPVIALAQGTTSEPRFKLDKAQNRVVELSNLSPSDDCHPARIQGRVVKRSFDENGIVVQMFTIEESSGERSLINIDTAQLDEASMVARGWVVKGLQTLLREGQQVSVRIKLCGAAGRVVLADAIRPLRGR
ncbi:hypothetical protein ACD578_08945 [Microvirga sp. RSM25]|uniref:hypothetical protein n=1 Tax=Microvirga sp. RSM25 TaxID=3273802 RepID=UPI00385048C0